MPRISVVIPTYNESAGVHRALESTQVPGVERIVVDGGSSDGTPDVARSLGAERVLAAPAGRGKQLQVGYASASAETIVFLHADTVLEAGWEEAILRAVDDPRVMGGAFRLRFESDRWIFRWIEGWVRLRCYWLGLPYGDQALFARRKLIEAIGGVPDAPIFEDLDLARAIRAHGRLALLPLRAWTSPRRYLANGVLRMLTRNFVALLGYSWGLDRERVAAWYRRRPRG